MAIQTDLLYNHAGYDVVTSYFRLEEKVKKPSIENAVADITGL